MASDTNALTDVFTRDTTSGTTQLVSMGINRPPTMQFSVTPDQGDTDTTFSASISGPSDPDGDPLTYVIDWDDGDWSSSQSATHVYESEGDFLVTGQVTDSFGASASASETVRVCAVFSSGQCVQSPTLPRVVLDPAEPEPIAGLHRVPVGQECTDHGLGTAGWHNGEPLCGHLGNSHPAVDSGRVSAAVDSPDQSVIGEALSDTRDLCSGGDENVIQVIYAFPKTEDEVDNQEMQEIRELIRRKVARTDGFLDRSTPKKDGQHFRWKCKVDPLRVEVEKVEIIEVDDSYAESSSTGCVKTNDDPEDTIVTTSDVTCSLKNQTTDPELGGTENFDSGAYLVFLNHRLTCNRANCSTTTPRGEYAGSIGFTYPHTSDTAVGPAWAIAGLNEGIWPADNPLHELLHIFGAVQVTDLQGHDPPQSTGEGHTFAEDDVMWSPAGGRLDDKCIFGEERAWWVDCGRNTYYGPNPTPGRYLANHPSINIVNNPFLKPFQ